MLNYVVGIIIGSIVILIAMLVLLIFANKQRIHKNEIKKIGLKPNVKINNDIKIWAKQTKNQFISSSFFKYGNNKIFKIDSILITSKALIIIKIKSIRGIINGDSQEMIWKKTFDNQQYHISNPILTNERNIDHIVKMTNIKVPTISLIIFSNLVQYIDVKNLMPHVVVIKHLNLFDALDQIDNSLKTVLSEYEMKTIYSILKSYKMSKYLKFKLKKELFVKKRSKY